MGFAKVYFTGSITSKNSSTALHYISKGNWKLSKVTLLFDDFIRVVELQCWEILGGKIGERSEVGVNIEGSI